MKRVGLFLIFLVLLLNVLHTNPLKICAKIACITPNKIKLHFIAALAAGISHYSLSISSV